MAVMALCVAAIPTEWDPMNPGFAPLSEEKRSTKCYQKRAVESSNGTLVLSNDKFLAWEGEFFSDPKNQVVQNALAHSALLKVVSTMSSSQSLRDVFLFNVEVDPIGSPSYLDDQASSGRCWIFAACNVMRASVMKSYNVSSNLFQLSQSYLAFYDRLEKANVFFNSIIDSADQDLDSPTVQELFKGLSEEGGLWEVIVNLVEKYGMVPNQVFPDNAQAGDSSGYNFYLKEKSRDFGLTLRDMVSSGASAQDIADAKEKMNQQIYNIVSMALGTPPLSTDTFRWEFMNGTGDYNYYDTTPLDFYRNFIGYNVSERFLLRNFPNMPINELQITNGTGEMVGGRQERWLNADISSLKEATIKMLQNNEPVFFSSNINEYKDRDTGIYDTNAYDYGLVFGYDLNSNKLQRLNSGGAGPDHAMVFTGVHLDPVTNSPIRWKVENSWGDTYGKKGYLLMTDDYFDNYVFDVTVSLQYLDKSLQDIWNGKNFTMSPEIDPSC